MKKTIMAVAAAVMMSVSALAQQEVQPQQAGDEPRQMDKTELVKQHTERMVTEYGLNADQAAKLLEVNTQYFDKMPFMMMRGQRGGQRGQRPQQMRGGQRPQRMGGDSLRFGGQRPQRIGGERGQRPMMNREEMQKNVEAYNAEVEKILTADQFTKFKESQQRPQQRGQRGAQRGQRPQRQSND